MSGKQRPFESNGHRKELDTRILQKVTDDVEILIVGPIDRIIHFEENFGEQWKYILCEHLQT